MKNNNYSFDQSKIDQLFTAADNTNSPGAVCGIAINGQPIYRKAFGMASVQHGVANTVNTRMRIGSTTKHFACLAALLLAEDGKLDLDIPATEYLPELPTDKEIPTLRQFMNHTSGYRCCVDLAMNMNGASLQPKGWSKDILARQKQRNFKPNQAQMYNNGGYHLLSIAIDRVAGMSLEEFLHERVFLPLGMTNTVGILSDNTYVKDMASLHMPNVAGGYDRGAFFWEDIRGEGNIVSTIDDMLRWQAHMHGEQKIVGSDESWQQMFATPTLANGLKSVYSLGLQTHHYRGVKVVHHAGSVIGGNSQMLSVPDFGLDIIVIANGVNVNCQENAKAIVDIILEEQLNGDKPEIAKFEPFKHLAGHKYHGKQSGVMIGFGDLAGTLGTAFMNSPLMPILKEKDGNLYAGFEDIALGPIEVSNLQADNGKAPQTITYSESGNIETLELVSTDGLDCQQIHQSLCGDYYSHDGNANVCVSQQDDMLLMEIRGDYSPVRKFKLEALSASAISVESLDTPGAGCAMTIRQQDDKVNAFELDMIRGRHLEFTRK